jgi:3-oxoacyl-[acyl-carrier-protein] synthase II
MKAPKNRKVYVAGYGVASPLGSTFPETWEGAVSGKTGFRKVSKCEVTSQSNVVGEIPNWDPLQYDFINEKEVYNWNANFIILTMIVVKEALDHAGIVIEDDTGPRTACFIGSALNGCDAYREAMNTYNELGPLRISPYLLPNLCGNLPAAKAGIHLGFTGPNFSPQGACASGNHAVGIGARMIRDGDFDFVIAGGVDTCIIPEIIYGFDNMNATIKVREGDRAFNDPSQASRPFSVDRKGFVLSEGAGAIVLAADEVIDERGLTPIAEVCGIGWNSDAHHFTRPNKSTIVRAIEEAIDDADMVPDDIMYINAHGTSTPKGDEVEVDCLRTVFGDTLKNIPISSNKSQIGHTIGAAAAIENALSLEGMRQGIILPTVNYVPDPKFDGLDFVPNAARKQKYNTFLSNSFGFGGTNCCVIFRGM